jgi:hypothetical protein
LLATSAARTPENAGYDQPCPGDPQELTARQRTYHMSPSQFHRTWSVSTLFSNVLLPTVISCI